MEYRDYYVYALIDPEDMKPFYIGKGKDNRAWSHLKDCENINEDKISKIKAIREKGNEPIVEILVENLYEVIAYRIESYYINILDNLTNIKIPNYKEHISNFKSEEPVRIEEACSLQCELEF